MLYRQCLRNTYFTYMRWIYIYCNKIMDKANFIDFIKESDDSKGEHHDWRLLLSSEGEAEVKEKERNKIQSTLIQCSLV